MKRLYNRLIPAFFKRWDHHLLIHHPWVWATKIHHIAYWWLISLALLSGITWGQMQIYMMCYQADMDRMEITLRFIELIKFLGLGFWLWRLSAHHWLLSKVPLSQKSLLKRSASLFLGVIGLSFLPVFYVALLVWQGIPAELFLAHSFWSLGWYKLLITAPVCYLLLEIAVQLRARDFWALLIGRILLMAISLFAYNIFSSILIHKDSIYQLGLPLYILGEIFLLLRFGYLKKKKRYKINLQVASLAMIPIILSFVQIFWLFGIVYEFLFDENPVELGLLFGIYLGFIGLGLFLWHLFFRKRITQLYLQARS
ncbi:MAG: hypothetical protein AAF927_31860 [Bacteroidota bacterium]